MMDINASYRLDGLPEVASSDVPSLNLLDVTAVNSVSNALVLSLRNGKSIIVTGTLKHAVVPCRAFVTIDKAFTWIRGAAMSG